MHSSHNRVPTLYPTQKESYRALTLGVEFLQGSELKRDDQGFCLIEDLCQAIIEKDNSFGYMNKNHIIEFFFKDVNHKILISGMDKIKYKDITYVKPPKFLYFGTIENYITKMKKYGIRSNTKGYIKLYETTERACTFAEKFARPGELTVALKIDAEKAFSDGLKFSTFLEGEYIVVQLLNRYIV